MNTFVLIMFLGMTPGNYGNVSTFTQEFSSEDKCLSAGRALIKASNQQGFAKVFTWGCYAK